MANESKRKFHAESEDAEPLSKKRTSPPPGTTDGSEQAKQSDQQLNTSPSASADRLQDRLARFRVLQARQNDSRLQNRKETAAESQRLSTDPNLLKSLDRKHAIASHKIMKADAAAAGEDFERKRAWDWTVEESEKWDRRMEKKDKHREDVAFQDFRQQARKTYKRQMKEMGAPDLEAYEQEKADAVQKAADNGRLEITEMRNGDLVAVDRDGTFYSTADTTDFTDNRPRKANVDRLVNDLRKAEDVRLKRRKDRGKEEQDDGDVTFINEKNKVNMTPLTRICLNKKLMHLAAIQHEAPAILRQIHHGHPRQFRERYSHMTRVTVSCAEVKGFRLGNTAQLDNAFCRMKCLYSR